MPDKELLISDRGWGGEGCLEEFKGDHMVFSWNGGGVSRRQQSIKGEGDHRIFTAD